jgi:hypothetical protein
VVLKRSQKFQKSEILKWIFSLKWTLVEFDFWYKTYASSMIHFASIRMCSKNFSCIIDERAANSNNPQNVKNISFHWQMNWKKECNETDL